MLAWLSENLGTIIVLLLVLIAIVAASNYRKMVKDKKQGKGSCGCGCEHCTMHGKCHKVNKKHYRGDAYHRSPYKKC